MRYFVLIAMIVFWPRPSAAAGQISTFMEGTLVEKSIDQWVVTTPEGTYWIKLSRPLSWIRRNTGAKVSFWVRLDQITRFRPLKSFPASASVR